MKKIPELTDTELRQAYVVAVKSYTQAYKDKKAIEEEMYKRFEIELERNK